MYPTPTTESCPLRKTSVRARRGVLECVDIKGRMPPAGRQTPNNQPKTSLEPEIRESPQVHQYVYLRHQPTTTTTTTTKNVCVRPKTHTNRQKNEVSLEFLVAFSFFVFSASPKMNPLCVRSVETGGVGMFEDFALSPPRGLLGSCLKKRAYKARACGARLRRAWLPTHGCALQKKIGLFPGRTSCA